MSQAAAFADGARAFRERVRAWAAEGGAASWRAAGALTVGALAIPAMLYGLDGFNVRNLTMEALFGLPFGPAAGWRRWVGLVALLLLLGAPLLGAAYALMKAPLATRAGEVTFARSLGVQASGWIPAAALLLVAAVFATVSPAEDLFVGDVVIGLAVFLGVAALMLRDQGLLREVRIDARRIALVGWAGTREVPLVEVADVRLRAGRVELLVGEDAVAVPADELFPVGPGARRADAFGFHGPLGAKGFAATVRALVAEAKARAE